MTFHPTTSGLRVMAAAALLTFGLPAFADDAPSADDIVKALQSKADRGVSAAPAAAAQATSPEESALLAALKMKASRGLSVSEVEGEQLATVLPSKPKIDLEINFGLNSAEVTETTRPVIMALGKALQSDNLKGSTFVIAGHTDKSGSADYNKRLSQRRAESIRKFLIDNHNLKSEQLIVVGYGNDRPKNARNPFSAENRRAEIVNVEPASVAAQP